MNRREIIQYTALASGAAVCSPLLSLLLSGCSTDPSKMETGEGLSFFNKTDFELIRELADLILPKTDSPSASEVKVPELIDRIVGTAYRDDERKKFEDQFAGFKGFLEQKSFGALNQEEKIALLNSIPGGTNQKAKSGFIQFKQLTVAFYLSTEVIATTYLNFLPVPGTYEPCITLDDVDRKAWAI